MYHSPHPFFPWRRTAGEQNLTHIYTPREKSFTSLPKSQKFSSSSFQRGKFSSSDAKCSFKIVSCRAIFCFVPMKAVCLPWQEKQTNIHLARCYSNDDTAWHMRTLRANGSFKHSLISDHFYNECQNISESCVWMPKCQSSLFSGKAGDAWCCSIF